MIFALESVCPFVCFCLTIVSSFFSYFSLW